MATVESAGDGSTRSNFAKCYVCMFGFCVQCKEPWHEGQCADLYAKADALEARAGGSGSDGGGRVKHSHLSKQLRQRILDL